MSTNESNQSAKSDRSRQHQHSNKNSRNWDGQKEKRPRDPYDPSKDKLIETIGKVPLNRHNTAYVSVEVRSYDDEPARVGLFLHLSEQRRKMVLLDKRASEELSQLVSRASLQLKF